MSYSLHPKISIVLASPWPRSTKAVPIFILPRCFYFFRRVSLPLCSSSDRMHWWTAAVAHARRQVRAHARLQQYEVSYSLGNAYEASRMRKIWRETGGPPKTTPIFEKNSILLIRCRFLDGGIFFLLNIIFQNSFTGGAFVLFSHKEIKRCEIKKIAFHNSLHYFPLNHAWSCFAKNVFSKQLSFIEKATHKANNFNGKLSCAK